MQLVQGLNLRRFVKEQGAQPDYVVNEWALQLGEILKYLHSLKPPVMHRDFTPDNLVIEENGQLTLIDFGASILFLGTVTGTMIGKSSYMPVEQFKGRATLKSDIYALGGTLYFLLTGADPEPFEQSNPLKIKNVNNDLAKLISQCTEIDQNNRPDILEFISLAKSLNIPRLKS